MGKGCRVRTGLGERDPLPISKPLPTFMEWRPVWAQEAQAALASCSLHRRDCLSAALRVELRQDVAQKFYPDPVKI